MTKQDQIKALLEPYVIDKTNCEHCKYEKTECSEEPCCECYKADSDFKPSKAKQSELTDLVDKIDEIYKNNDKGFTY